MKKAMKRFAIIASLLLVLLALSGCSVWNPSAASTDTENKDFYVGAEGVEMRFVQGSPPPRLFYYSDEDNTFDVAVELHNRGASDAYGAVYVTNFPPDMISIEGTETSALPLSDCLFNFGNLGFSSDGGFGFSLDCLDGLSVGYNNGDVQARWTKMFNLWGISIEGLQLDVFNGNWNFGMAWSLFGSNTEIFHHGRALAIVLGSLNLEYYNGYLFSESGVLRGDNYYYPGGEYGFIDMTGHIFAWPAGLDELNMNLNVHSCYGYATYAAPTICIDPTPYDIDEDDCTPREYTWSGSQGAPVAISSIKQDPAGDKLYLTFTIRHVGGGSVVDLGHLERCSPYFLGNFGERYRDVVYIADARIGNQRMVCTPGYRIRLNDGVGTFTCEYELLHATSRTGYETPAVVELWYGYHDEIETNMYIKRVA